MKILHVAPIPSTQASGFFHSILGLAKAQADLGHDVAISCSEPNSFSKEFCPLNVSYFKGPKKRHVNPFEYPKFWHKQILESFGIPDIVNFHGTYIPLHFGFAKYCVDHNIPYIHTPRGDLKIYAQKSKRLKKALANILVVNSFLKKSSAIHALTEFERHEISLKFPMIADKIFISPNGVDKSFFSFSNAEKAIPKSSKCLKLILVGRIDFEIKGIDLILNALLLLEEKALINDFTFTLIGPFYNELDKKRYNNLINKFKIKDKIIYLGPLYGESKIIELTKSDVFICTSRSEGMPIALLEAMALGKPCLVTPGSNSKSYIIDSDSGWFTEENPVSISKALERILNAPQNEIVNKGNNAMKYAQENFSWEQIAKSIIDRYKILIG